MRISDWSSDVCSSDLPDMRKIVITDSSIREFSTYDGLTQAILDHDMPERTGTTVLDHYTDGGFKGIMQSQALWLAPITLRLNQGELDTFALEHGLEGYVYATGQATPLMVQAHRKSTRLNSSH